MLNKLFDAGRMTCLIILICNVMMPATAQSLESAPKNFAGFLAGIEWNTISGVTGVEYERMLLAKEKLTMGIKGSYYFRYKQGNMQIFNSPCCEMSTITTVFATADYFTSRRAYPSGFFFHAGAGAGLKTYRWQPEMHRNSIRPAFEAGIGWLFLLGDGLALKWTNTVTFPSADGGITITRLALGW